MIHGTSRYSKGCRCVVCRAAKSEYVKNYNARRSEEFRRTGAVNKHGATGYRYGCRCEICQGEAATVRRAGRKARHSESYRARLRSRVASGDPTLGHGKSYIYSIGGCRCKECLDAHIARRYRSLKSRSELIGESAGICPICKIKVSDGALQMDHDHSTGIFRGMLCGRCNSAIGKFRDNPETISRAIHYLKVAAGESVQDA